MASRIVRLEDVQGTTIEDVEFGFVLAVDVVG